MTQETRCVGIDASFLGIDEFIGETIELVLDDMERFYDANPLRHNYLISFKSEFGSGSAAHECLFIDGLDPVLEDLVNTCIRCEDWGYGPLCETHAKEFA